MILDYKTANGISEVNVLYMGSDSTDYRCIINDHFQKKEGEFGMIETRGGSISDIELH